MNEDYKKNIRKYLLDNVLFGFTEDELKDNGSFLDMGILDSTGVMELVTFIEREFNIDIKDEEIIPDNLDSIENINCFILKKKMVIE